MCVGGGGGGVYGLAFKADKRCMILSWVTFKTILQNS